MEEGLGVPPAGSRGEHLLQIQNDHWRSASSSSSGITAKGGPNRLQHSESNGCARPARLLFDRQRTKIAREGRADATWPIHAPTPQIPCDREQGIDSDEQGNPARQCWPPICGARANPYMPERGREMRLRPIWEVLTSRQVADFVSDFNRPSFRTLRRPSRKAPTAKGVVDFVSDFDRPSFGTWRACKSVDFLYYHDDA